MDKNRLKTLKNQRKNGIISSVKLSILKEMKKAGVGIIISSDCHDCNFLTHGFDRAIELCKECGIRELQIFTKEGFKGISLD